MVGETGFFCLSIPTEFHRVKPEYIPKVHCKYPHDCKARKLYTTKIHDLEAGMFHCCRSSKRHAKFKIYDPAKSNNFNATFHETSNGNPYVRPFEADIIV